MRWVIALALSAVAMAADPAGWSVLRWGMTEAQVLAALPDVRRLPDLPKYRFDGFVPLGLEVKLGGEAYQVFLFPDQDGRLEEVKLAPVDRNQTTEEEYHRLELLLAEKYGRPLVRETTSQWTFATTTIALRYVQMRQVAFRSLWLTYRKKSPQPDAL